MEIKICKMCKEDKALTEYSRDYKGKYVKSYCKKCMVKKSSDWYCKNREKVAEYQRDYQKKHSQVYKDRMKNDPVFKKKKRAAIKASLTLTRRNICEICCTSPTEFHHEDYDEPLEVIELCVKCHHFLHKQYRDQEIILNT